MALTWAHAGGAHAQPRPVKVMIVTMFAPEAAAWIANRHLTEAIPIPGLSSDYPDLHCAPDGVCLVTTGMGYANAAASIAALVYSDRLDLRRTYWLISGIAGINPHRGTLGSVAWARTLVDGSLQWELDDRDAPPDWPTGFLGINTTSPAEKPKLEYHTEIFRLNEPLLQRAFDVSKRAELSDSPEIRRARAHYPPPADQPPTVIACDTVSGNTWFSGTHLAQRAEAWTKLLSDGRAQECTTQQEDNATFEVLKRATAAHRADDQRVLDERAGSDFDRPPPGGNEVANLLDYQSQGGFTPALTNLYRAGNPVVQDLLAQWPGL